MNDSESQAATLRFEGTRYPQTKYKARGHSREDPPPIQPTALPQRVLPHLTQNKGGSIPEQEINTGFTSK